MNQNLVFRIRCSQLNEASEASSQFGFWNSARNTQDLKPPEQEARLVNRFGKKLREELTHFVVPFYGHFEIVGATSPSANRRYELVSRVVFRPEIVGYGSLILDLFTPSVKELVELFEGDIDRFIDWLRVYVPHAMNDSVGFDAFSMKYEVTAAPGTLEAWTACKQAAPSSPQEPSVKAQSDIAQTISASQAKVISDASAAERKQKLYWFFNGSLIVPVLMALAVVFWYFFSVVPAADKSRADLIQRYEKAAEMRESQMRDQDEQLRTQREALNNAYKRIEQLSNRKP